MVDTRDALRSTTRNARRRISVSRCGYSALVSARHQPTKTRETRMPDFTWDHTHIKTYDVVGSAAWLQDKLGARSVEGTTVSEARADLLIGGTKVIVTQVKQGDGTNATPAIPYAGF